MRRIDSSAAGLDSPEAQRRLAAYGPNRLRSARGQGALVRLLLQFHNLLIYVLLGTAAIAAALGEIVDAAVIAGVVVINAGIGFVQEGKAEKAIQAIRHMLSLRARVLRGGERCELPAEELVPGDVVLLASGDKVPADLRLLEVKNLRVDEAALTGESQPVEKQSAPVPEAASLGDRLCMAYTGTLVTHGQAHGVVVATGERTEIGRISRLLEQVEAVSTPLLRQMTRFGRTLTLFILGVSAAVFLFGTLVRSYGVADMFMAVAGLAVAAIPEGLPAIMTITLAIGVQRMARRRAIVRRLPAVEALGSVTVICTDKTGTLTRNEMAARLVLAAEGAVEVSGAGYAPQGVFKLDGKPTSPEALPWLQEIARAGLLCNDAVVRGGPGQWVLEGDPTEGALYTLGLKAGLSPSEEAAALPRADVIPFESEHRFMATLHHDHLGHRSIYLKGAPETVLGRCARQRRRDGDEPLDLVFWRSAMETAASHGHRLLAVAVKATSGGQRGLALAEAENGFTLLGVVGMMDPPRDDAIDAVRQCREAGIQVKMVTGDHAVTARAVAAQIGLNQDGRVLSGAELDRLSEDELRDAAAGVSVFARVSPEHKLRLVSALQRGGDVVAMTGDGVNDSPALKRADVGVAMGMKGTEAAKEASDMILADDNFASIASAVEEGRTVYENIKKAIVYILPTNGGEAAAIVVAILLGVALPITAVQILWVNMVTEVTLSLSIAFGPGEPDIMRRAPRDPREPLLSRFLAWRILFVTLLLFAGTMGLFLYELSQGASNEVARTVAVNALTMGEIFYLFNSRHLKASCLSIDAIAGNRYALVAVAILMLLQMGFVYFPFMQEVFGTGAMDAQQWMRVVSFGLLVFFVVEAEKALLRWSDSGPSGRTAQS